MKQSGEPNLASFYKKFVPNMAAMLTLRYDELNNEKCFSGPMRQSMQQSKTWLTRGNVSIYYDQRKEIWLVCTRSAYGEAVILFHKIGRDKKRIACASRVLSKARLWLHRKRCSCRGVWPENVSEVPVWAQRRHIFRSPITSWSMGQGKPIVNVNCPNATLGFTARGLQ